MNFRNCKYDRDEGTFESLRTGRAEPRRRLFRALRRSTRNVFVNIAIKLSEPMPMWECRE